MKSLAVICLVVAFVAIASAASPEPDSSSQRQSRSDERKYRYEQDKKEVSTFLNTKNILRTVVKLLFGNSEESTGKLMLRLGHQPQANAR